MLKLSLFFIIFLSYLGLANSFAPSNTNFPLLKDSNYYQTAMKLQPNESSVSLILQDQYQTGVFFKTYIQRYLLIRSYKEAKVITVRTSNKFYTECQNKIGLSLFRITAYHQVSLTPLPAGFNFIGNPTLGKWNRSHSGDKRWIFYAAYQDFYKNHLPQKSKIYNFSSYTKVLLNSTVASTFKYGKSNHAQPEIIPQTFYTYFQTVLKQQFQLTLFNPSKMVNNL